MVVARMDAGSLVVLLAVASAILDVAALSAAVVELLDGSHDVGVTSNKIHPLSPTVVGVGSAVGSAAPVICVAHLLVFGKIEAALAPTSAARDASFAAHLKCVVAVRSRAATGLLADERA
jgi:hypothetical protein